MRTLGQWLSALWRTAPLLVAILALLAFGWLSRTVAGAIFPPHGLLDRGRTVFTPATQQPARELVVMVHGWTRGPSRLGDVQKAVVELLPDADVLIPAYDSRMLSNADPVRLAADLEHEIHRRFRAGPNGGYDRVTLIGHSVGALLVRKAFVFASGEIQDFPDGIQPPVGRVWHTKVNRLVLFAAVSRGLTMDDPDDHDDAASRKPGVRIRRLGQRLLAGVADGLGVGRFILGFERGDPLVANLRIQWIRLAWAGRMPPVYQLLGDRDGVMTAGDNLDLVAMPNAALRTLRNTRHQDGVELYGSDDADERRQVFAETLVAPSDELIRRLGGQAPAAVAPAAVAPAAVAPVPAAPAGAEATPAPESGAESGGPSPAERRLTPLSTAAGRVLASDAAEPRSVAVPLQPTGLRASVVAAERITPADTAGPLAGARVVRSAPAWRPTLRPREALERPAVRATLTRFRSARGAEALAADSARNASTAEQPVVQRVAFVVHGIRDYGPWARHLADTLSAAARRQGTTLIVETPSYDYFSMGAFLIPHARRRNVRWFMDRYTQALAQSPNAQFDFVGHSNGTHVLAQGLRAYRTLAVHNVFLAGSVVPRRFPWKEHLEGRRVSRVFNVVAEGDMVVGLFPKFFEWIHSFTGIDEFSDIGSGGFAGFTDSDPRLVQLEYVRGDHGAGIQRRVHPLIAAYVLSGEPIPASLWPGAVEERAGWKDRLSGACWIVWLVLVGLIALIVLGAGWLAGRFGPPWLARRAWLARAAAFAVILAILGTI